MVKARNRLIRVARIVFHCFEVVMIAIALLICLYWFFSGHETLKDGCERIQGITGYPISEKNASLLLHKNNLSSSIVMVNDLFRGADEIESVMRQLMTADKRWRSASINQNDVHRQVSAQLAYGYRSYDPFRVICDIDNGDFDFMFVDNPNRGDTSVCLVDVDTATIALYIYLD